MSTFRAYKVVSSLPAQIDANTVYYVRVGAGFDTYVTDNTGSIAHKQNSGDMPFDVNLTPIDYVPADTGNTANLGEFVTDPNGDVWVIDLEGDALQLSSQAEPFKELRRFYVDPNGSDDTGNGAAGNPYLTPQAAIDQMPSGSGFITILNEGVTGDFTLSRTNTAVTGASSAYASSSRPNNVTVSTPSGVSNRLADMTILGTLQRTGNAPLYLNNITVNGQTTIGGTAFAEIKDSTLQDSGITQTGASTILIRDSLLGSSTFTTSGATILLRDVAISAGQCVTIGAGVVYSLSGVQGCVTIDPAAIPVEDALLASGFPEAAALAAETTAFNNLRITNPPLVSSPATVLTYNQTTGQVEHTDAANLSPADTFETVSKNLRSEGATLGYDGAGNLTTLTYADGIVKSLAYNAGGDLETITLSGATPDGISLVKTLTYTNGNLTGVAYT